LDSNICVVSILYYFLTHLPDNFNALKSTSTIVVYCRHTWLSWSHILPSWCCFSACIGRFVEDVA